MGDFNNEQEEKNMSNFLNVLTKFETYCQTKQLFWKPRYFQDICTVETRLSDLHKLVVTVLKVYFPKQKPNIQTFRDCKRFQNELFRSELDYERSKLDVCNLEYEHFLDIFIEILNKHAPMKKTCLRVNQGEFMTKELNKEIMTWSRLSNNYLNEKCANLKIAYDK